VLGARIKLQAAQALKKTAAVQICKVPGSSKLITRGVSGKSMGCAARRCEEEQRLDNIDVI